MSKKKEVISNEVATESDGEEKRTVEHFCKNPSLLNPPARRHVLQEMIKGLPNTMQNRIRVMKNIQLEQMKLEAEFYQEIYKLEKKYFLSYQPFFDKRKEIVTGELEPKPEEANWKSDNDDNEISEKMKDITLKAKKNCILYSDDVKGVPDFWLKIFRNIEMLSEMVQEHDEPALKKLRDIKISYEVNPMSYTLEFHFDKNDYFSNPVLTKQYFLKSTVDNDYPWTFEGPEIYKCTGCTINWERGNNLTIKTIRKKQKHKERGAVRTITKQVPNDSFFNFFNPPEYTEDKEKLDDESQSILATDFEIGHFLRTRVIPRAVLYYTGDIVDDEDDDDYDEEEEEEEDDEEEDDDYDADDDEGNTGQQKTANKKSTPNECQSQ